MVAGPVLKAYPSGLLSPEIAVLPIAYLPSVFTVWRIENNPV